MTRSDALDLFAALRKRKISVVVPVFNEGREILSNLKLLISEVGPHFAHFEVLVVSDGSTDETNAELAKINDPHVRTIILSKNQGKGFAVRRGFSESQGEYLLFVDGGMELHPKDIRTFLALLVLYDADIVIGSKRHPQSKVDYPWIRRVLSFSYQQIIRLLFSLDVTDTQVGMKIFRRDVISAILEDLTVDRYGFDLEMLALAQYRGYTKMLEAPIRLDYFQNHVRKNPISELFHIAKVAFSVFRDTISVYQKIRRLKKIQKKRNEISSF